MPVAFVSAGSNIDPERNIREALHRLAGRVKVTAISTVYQTPAMARPADPPFYNCVARIETPLPPLELKRGVLNEIENELGRRRGADKCAPRTIDLDLLLYDDLVLDSPELRLPDGDILARPFLVLCLHELAPELGPPGSGASLAQAAAAAAAAPREGTEALPRYTADLRGELAGIQGMRERM
jgi:2-amino-4-hydroxy-6-hydroxymethyldihydropteridine diphosphokinase